MRKINLIIIHCTASRPNQHVTLEMLHQMHRARGWKQCGYHYYITRDGQLHQGRSEEEPGAHARHYNAHSIGICYEEASTPRAVLPTPAPPSSARPSSPCSAR